MIHPHLVHHGAVGVIKLGLKMGKVEEYGKFIGSVALALVVIGIFQKNVMAVPVIGAYLPGAKPAA